MHRLQRAKGLVAGITLVALLLPTTVVSAADEPLKVSYVGESSADDIVWNHIVSQLRTYMDEQGVDFVDRFAEGDFARQARMIDEELARGVDGIIATFFDEEMAKSTIPKMLEQGVVVYAVGGVPPLDEAELEQVGIRAIDWTVVGQEYAKLALPLLEDGATVLWPAEVPEGSYITDAVAGFQDVAAEAGKTVNIDVLDAGSDISVSAARQVAYLTANPETDAVVTSGAIASGAAIAAMRDMGLAPGEIPVIAQVGDPSSARGVVDGYMPVGGLWLAGDAAAWEQVVKEVVAMAGGAEAQQAPMPPVVVTADNIADVVPADFLE